ncbi:MAG TPA: T9SS type A sorting domain-containing protein [Bacteroidia bacterium]|nr:T9SS type A sorting domain-containing protein [Bacteroidia bacterium]
MLKIYIFLAFILFMPCSFIQGQGISNLWLMGYDCGGPGCGGTNIDFFHGSPDTQTVHRDMNFRQTSASISDSSGQLLFYTNGVYIANRNNALMINGDSLNPSDYTDTWRNDGLKISQGDLILPSLYNDSIYFLFHETIFDFDYQLDHLYQPIELLYTQIDMRLDSGRGAVVFKNIPVIADTLLVGEIAACKHSNGRDWWIICHRFNSDLWYTLLLTPYGLQGPFSQHAGQFIYQGGGGQTVFSPDGTRFIRHQLVYDLDVFDFDRCTGLLSNYRHSTINDTSGGVGVSISPNSELLYVTEDLHVYQYDLNALNLDSSRRTVAIYDGFSDPFPPFKTTFYLSLLANDNKIYINTGNGTPWLHVINHPDSAGLACDVQQHSFKLPTVNAATMPNYPNFFLGAEGGTVCDSLITVTESRPQRREGDLLLFPNPCRGLLYVYQNNISKIERIEIRNSIGKLQSIPVAVLDNGEYIQIDASGLIAGVYIVSIRSENSLWVKRFIKE